MPSGQTKKQHVVAEFYLAGFAKNGQLATRMRNGHTGNVSIKRATVREEFYTFRDGNGTRNQSVEEWLSTDIEGPVAPILASLRGVGQPGPADASALARFVTTSMLRTATTTTPGRS